MRDDQERCSPRSQSADDRPLPLHLKRSRRLIEYDQLGVSEHAPGNKEALTLPPGKAATVFRRLRIQLHRETANELVKLGAFEGLVNPRLFEAVPIQRNVLTYGAGYQPVFLKN